MSQLLYTEQTLYILLCLSFKVTPGLFLMLSIMQTLNDKFTILISIFILAISLAIDLPDLGLLSYLETCILLI